MTERNKKVDKLIDLMENHKDKNGFWGKTDAVSIRYLPMQEFKIDDKTIYYDLFENLNKKLKYTNLKNGAALGVAIAETVSAYFGSIPADERKRAQLTQTHFDENDELVVPSISALKHQNCAKCVEYASVSHNFWLLTGRTSYYFSNVDFEHAFNIVVGKNGKPLLFDLVRGKVQILEDQNAIEKIMNNKEFVINGFTYSGTNLKTK